MKPSAGVHTSTRDQSGGWAGVGGWGGSKKHPADEFLSREVDREQRISCYACANPRRGQAGTGLQSRSRQLPGRGWGAAWAGCGLQEWELACQRNARAHPRAKQHSQSPSRLAPFPPRKGEANAASGQGRVPGDGFLGVPGPRLGRPAGAGRRVERGPLTSPATPSAPSLPSRPRP